MLDVVGVRFKKAGKIYYFSPEEMKCENGDNVIVETVRGIELGTVVIDSKQIDENILDSPLKSIIKKADIDDLNKHFENKELEKKAFDICIKKILKHKLDMKLIDVEYTFDKKKVIFYFTAEGRIDFRELVKDLAQIFKTRIELRQIGVRDEAKTLGGIGPCGKNLCCASWLGEFEPVSIKMAKDQGLSLNPTKISGVCGRLFCCLKYEDDVYEEILKKMPRVDARVKTPIGEGIVIELKTILESVKVKVKNKKENTEEIQIFNIKDIEVIKQGKNEEEK